MPQTYYRSFIKDNSVVIGGHILIYMKGIIFMPIIIKTVGVTIYGGFVLITTIFGIAFGISSFGTGFMAKRFMPSAKSMVERRELFYPQFFFQILGILSLSLLLVLLEKQLNMHIFKNEITFSIWIIPLYLVLYLLYSQGVDYFRYTSRVRYMSLAVLCFPYLDLGFILLYLYGYGSISINMLVLSSGFSALLIAIPSFGVIFREISAKLFFYKEGSFISDMKLGFPLLLGFIVDFILVGSDRFFIAFYLTVADVGYYASGYALGSLIVFIPKAIGAALPQLLCRAVDNGNEFEAQRMLNYALKIFLLLAIPFIVGCLALSKPILTLLANQDVAEKAFWVAPIVALGTLFYGLNLILSNVMFVRMKTYTIFKVNALAAFFSLLANFILLFLFRNIIIAAITTFLSYIIAFIYLIIIVRNERWTIDFEPVTIVKCLFASLVMGGVLLWITFNSEGSNTVSLLVGKMALGIFVYATALFSFKTFSPKEISYMKRIFW